MPPLLSSRRAVARAGGLVVLASALVLLTGHAHAQSDLPVTQTMLATPFQYSLGDALAGAGDVNGDGFADLIAGIPAPGGVPGPDGLSRALLISGADGSILYTVYASVPGDDTSGAAAALGDLNGDGYDDFALGARLADYAGPNTGRVTVHSGFDGSILYQLDGAGVGAELGCSLASAGDVDGDGVQDLIVGARGDDVGALQSGSVFVLSGATGAQIHHFIGAAGDELGLSVAGPGDVDGDGIPDIVSGSPYADAPVFNAGYVRIYSGFDGSILHEIPGSGSNGGWGATVAAAGDVNGDGFGDVIASAPNESIDGMNGAGRVAVISGADGSILFEDTNSLNNDGLGREVAGFGDLNGDGYDDFGYVAPNDSTLFNAGGRLDVVSGFDHTLLFRVYAQQDLQVFGRALANAGDMNGDGRNDIAVGSLRLGGTLYGAFQVFSPPVPPFEGSRADLDLWTGVNSPATRHPFVKSAQAGDVVSVLLVSQSVYVGSVPVLAAQLHATGAPIAQPSGFPEVWVNPSPFAAYPVNVLFDGNSGPLAPSILGPGGITLAYLLPPGLSGFGIRLQAFALAPSPQTGNPIFTATNGCEIEVL
ncbi:MAG: FG-GAP-like repeat-containing protein [Planctomycetota bacterium]